MTQQDASKIVYLKVDEIFADPTFNCRGNIAPIDVIDLAKDIDAHGLQQAIVVKPILNGESKNLNHKYKVIMGHRRHKAFVVLGREMIPCVVNEQISDDAALILNLGENLHRKDLNILQEATAINRLRMVGYSYGEVAKQLGKSSTWALIRFQLLELPEEIREAAAAGYITQQQISALHKLGDYRKQIEAAKKIKAAKARGEKSPAITKPKRSMFKKRVRDPNDIFWMQEHIRKAVGNNFGTRCLAWAAGEITDLDVFRDLEVIAIEKGVLYEIPYKLMEQK